jgi:hypothetical protein
MIIVLWNITNRKEKVNYLLSNYLDSFIISLFTENCHLHRKVEGVFILEGFLHFLFDESCHLFVSLRIKFDQFPEIVIELKMRKRNVLFPLNDYFPAALFSHRLNLIVKMEIFTKVRHWNTKLLHAFNRKCQKITQIFISPYRQSQQASLSCH